MPISIAILVSGRGSNMAAILRAIDEGKLAATVPVVASNNPEAPALELARARGVETVAVSHRGMARAEHEGRLLEELAPYDVDFVVLAGYMRVLSERFLAPFRDPAGYYRIINIHPSLLPAFPGASGYEDAFAYGVRIAGVTVHLVDERVDHGPILGQETFPRLEDDTLDDFKVRGLAVEHRLYPEVLQRIAASGIRLLAPHEGVCVRGRTRVRQAAGE